MSEEKNGYEEIIIEMIDRKQGTLHRDILAPFITKLELIEPVSKTEVCRDPDDNKFIECAAGSKLTLKSGS